MIPNKIQELIKAIVEKTNSKKATWGKTAREKEFKLHFEKGAITTDNWDNDGKDMVDFTIYNSFGDQIERYAAFAGEDGFDIMMELHKAANRDFYKVDETISELFNEAKAEKSIGKREIETENEFPF